MDMQFDHRACQRALFAVVSVLSFIAEVATTTYDAHDPRS
jgi:hypothetical protein